MQKIEQDNTTVVIRDETVEVNGVLFVKKEAAEPEVHPFLKDVPKVGEVGYVLLSLGVNYRSDTATQSDIDRGTVSLNREALVELDNRRLALTALKKWIGENNIPVATEEQMAEYFLEKIGFRFDRSANMVEIYGWNWSQPIGDIHLVSTKDAEKVRDACDALIRKAYGWPEVG